MFFEARDGRRYPIAAIAAIRKVRADENEVELAGFKRVIASDRALQRAIVSTLPAQPETCIVRADVDAVGGFWLTPVIAWALTLSDHMLPVTANGLNDGTDEWHFILTPDRRVSRAGDRSWNNLEGFLASQRSAA